MAWKIFTISSALVLALACSDEPGGGDAGADGSVDATRDTSTGDSAIPDSSSDTSIADTSVTDSAASDSSVVDAADDAGDAGDPGGDGGGSDCAIGPCADGTAYCGGRAAYNCNGGCLIETPCGDADCAVVDGTAICGGCATIESAYSRLTTGAAAACSEDPDCQLLFGQCGVGLGGCHHAVNTGVTQEQLDDLGRMYGALSCSSVVCRCAPPPTTVACIAGTCIAPAP